MIIFGVSVGDGLRFSEVGQPTLVRAMQDGDLLLTDDGSRGICAAYNSFIARAAEEADCEALVLVHDDVELIDRNFRAKVLAAVSEPRVGVVGVIGASKLRSPAWWTGRSRRGRVMETRGPVVFQPGPADVDVVDGMLLILAPASLRLLHFDAEHLPHFHGYDVDICFRAKRAGLRVMVASIDVYHRTKGGFGNKDHFDQAASVLIQHWGDYFTSTTAFDRVTSAARQRLKAFRRRLVGGPHGQLVTRLTDPEPTGRSYLEAADLEVESGQTAVACPVCESEVRCPQPPLPSIGLCCTCGTGVTFPPPTADVTTDELFTNLYGGGRLARRNVWLAEAQQRMTWVQLYRPDGLLLDVGCATGEFVKVADEAGYESYGLETSTWAATAASDLAQNVTPGFIHDWKARYPGLRADVVTLWHVLEHVPEPRLFLAEIRDCLHTDGLLIGEIPNLASAMAQSDLRRWDDATLSDHFHHFTPSSLRTLLQCSGFAIETILPITKRNYVTTDGWLRHRNECVKRNIASPSLDFIRFVARPL